jgi:hypothetical protein
MSKNFRILQMAKPANLTSSLPETQVLRTAKLLRVSRGFMGLKPVLRPEQVETSADRLESPAAVAENLNVAIAYQQGKNY